MTTMLQDLPPEYDPDAPVTFTLEQTASRSALAQVVAGFNPSRVELVGKIKLLTAALITTCEVLRDRSPEPGFLAGGTTHIPNTTHNEGLKRGARWASIAATKYEEAAMFAVKAATATLPPR